MSTVLLRAACFVAAIALGYCLRRASFFRAQDFDLLARIVLKITLPAAIVASFAGQQIQPGMLGISLLGFGLGVLYILLGLAISAGKPAKARAFAALNLAGYNIGNFTMPFVQSLLGPAGVVATSLFDTGNSFICLGGAYGVASLVQQGGKFSFARIGKALLHSPPFITYIIMAALALAHIAPPQPVVAFAQLIADANAFLAMLMIGVGFCLSGKREQLADILRILAVRYAVAAAAALACYQLLPLALEYRQALAVLAFSPIASAAPPFTAQLQNDVGLSSAINSLSILISIACITAMLVAML